MASGQHLIIDRVALTTDHDRTGGDESEVFRDRSFHSAVALVDLPDNFRGAPLLSAMNLQGLEQASGPLHPRA